MRKPRLLDLCCGAGGCSVGYTRAGFDVVGVDINPQPRYPFRFVQGDALKPPINLRDFDVIHASPPCQAWSVANNIHGNTKHPRLIEPIRRLLQKSGKPYVIENVPRAPLIAPIVVCGLALGCDVKRHRIFESNIELAGTTCPKGHPGDWLCIFGHTVLERSPAIGRTVKNGPIFRRKHLGVERGRVAMGIDWMNREELSEAIPPVYTEYIGRQLLAAIR